MSSIEKFSVLMSVYYKDTPSYVRDCLQSLADQSLQANEIVLVKDGALSDKLNAVIDQFLNKLPLKIVDEKENKGLARALNVGIKHVTNELILRMDADDISLPHRFEKQVSYMSMFPKIDVCSSYIDEKNNSMEVVLSTRILPLDHTKIVEFAKTRSPINHPAVAYRKTAVLAVGGYPLMYPEDYALWCIMIAKGYKFANLPEVLLHMRAGDGMISRRGPKFLKGYTATYWLMWKLGSINSLLLIRNVLIQVIIRLSPSFLRKIFYRYARNIRI